MRQSSLSDPSGSTSESYEGHPTTGDRPPAPGATNSASARPSVDGGGRPAGPVGRWDAGQGAAPAASQASKVVGAMRAPGPGRRAFPAIDAPNVPDQVGTSFTSRPRTAN